MHIHLVLNKRRQTLPELLQQQMKLHKSNYWGASLLRERVLRLTMASRASVNAGGLGVVAMAMDSCLWCVGLRPLTTASNEVVSVATEGVNSVYQRVYTVSTT